MRIAISGSSGLIGRALTERWRSAGHRVIPLVRKSARETGADQIAWDPEAGLIEAEKLEGLDAVVHLAGESIAGGRWTTERKRRIVESRVKGTRLLCEALAGVKAKPGVLVAASAIGYYGSRGGEVLTERSMPGDGFLGETCVRWEAATEAALSAGIRVVNLRIGIVLAREGGAMGKMLPAFRFGLGGRLGRGDQWMSWVSLGDVVRIVEFVMGEAGMCGPVNAVGPEPVTNGEFTAALGKALGRATVFPVPRFALRLMLGKEMAEELLLSSARVKPEKLAGAGFEFECKTAERAIAKALGRNQNTLP